jgi:hypothetical protein
MLCIKEQRTSAKLCVKLGKAAAETHWMLCEAYGNEALNKMTTYKKQTKDFIHADHWLTVQEVAESTGLSIGPCHTVLTEDLGMHQVSLKFVPMFLTEDR